MNFDYIYKLYGLSPLQPAQPLNPGTVAEVWKLETDKGPFLLRTLTGKEQGEREWAICQTLPPHLCPAIFPGADGSPTVAAEGVWYQLQEYLDGDMPDPNTPGTPAKIAETVVALTHALIGCSPASQAADRFDLDTVWKEHRQNWPMLELSLPLTDADRRVAELTALPVCGTQVLHGDLGLWNMLDTAKGIRVIDFGEARMGDPYFDLASALGGLINHSTPELRLKNTGEFLSQCRAMMELDMSRLTNQLRLWVWRGLAQCVRSPESWKKMAGRFYNALIWCEENLHEL